MTYRESLDVMHVVDTWFRNTRHRGLDVVFANRCAIAMACNNAQEIENTVAGDYLYTLCNMMFRVGQEYCTPLPKVYRVVKDKRRETYGGVIGLTVGDKGRWLGASWLA